MESNSKLDVFPTVSVGVGYSDFVENFEPDMPAITKHLRSAGLTDAQIAETNIHFSDECYPRENGVTTYGNYINKKNLITIYGFEDVLIAGIIPERLEQAPEATITDTLTHELEHRISSFDSEQKKLNKAYERKIYFTSKRAAITMALGAMAAIASTNVYTNFVRPDASLTEIFALSLGASFGIIKAEKSLFKNKKFEEYLNHPDEQRARSAIINKNLIKISTKEY